MAPARDGQASGIRAAVADLETVAAERGIDASAFTDDLLARAVARLRGDEDREGLRAKAQAAVSGGVDALFDSVGDAVRKAA